MVEQNGRNLSGGQKQRLTIARALVKQPKLLILDDSASALDYATDARLRQALRSVKATTLIISQRISAVRQADAILVLDQGKPVGLGSHEQLMKDCTVYQEIEASQNRKEAAA
jgi:ATP-binding cassette subfamily B protein